jgi:hypothetical protein
MSTATCRIATYPGELRILPDLAEQASEAFAHYRW